MRWKNRRKSDNVNDIRGSAGTKKVVGGGLGAIITALVAIFVLKDPGKAVEALSQVGGSTSGGSQTTEQRALDPAEEELADFTETVLADTEDVWNELLNGYREPRMTLFTDQVQSGCGFQSAQVGPFYCPADNTIYIDLGFFDDMAKRMGAGGDFAQAYVVAHEVGHHLQNLMGTSTKVHQQRSRVSEEEGNELSVRLELQADFYAGVWAHHAERKFQMLEAGDIEEALNAATQIGDDTLQRKATGRVMPESFTHGTGAQRVRWFRRGFETGDVNQGDTFSIAYRDL